jgi:hypothetical protein
MFNIDWFRIDWGLSEFGPREPVAARARKTQRRRKTPRAQVRARRTSARYA